MRSSPRSPSPPLTAAFDRGPAKYFHGRKQVLSDFNKLIERAVQAKSGTTFLIQGAPGAGKSALMYECEKRAKGNGWKVVKMPARAFWDPDTLRRALDLGKIPQATGGTVEVSVGPFVKGGVTAEMASATTLDTLQDGKQPLLLKMDEAQTLGTTNAPPSDHAGTVTDVLNAIHNGEMNRPVILIAAGLGTTAKAFRSLGISRFDGDSFVELGALGKEAEHAVLHDWLTKEGGAKGDPAAWIDAIAQETHGWPQHIVSYVKPALKQLVTDERAMTKDGLNAVLEAGQRARLEYYERRADDFASEHRHCLARAFADIPLGESTTLTAIMSSLTQDYGEMEAEKLFNRALHRGMLHSYRGNYVVPIPSMQDWLVTNYAHIKTKSPPQTMEIRRSSGRNLEMDLGR